MIQLDDKANELLTELRQFTDISFETHNENYCGVSQQNNKAIIYYNPNNFSNSSIVHELLHIWLNKFEYFVGNHIYMICLSHPKLFKVFSKFLCDYIENVFDHNKMYPRYKELGYSDEEFIVNGLKEKCSIQDIKQLSLKFLNVYNAESINRFIGYLLSIYADHVSNDYSEHIKLLKAKDSQLFQIVTEFWNRWVNFDVTNVDSLYNSPFEISNPFIDEMENWIQNKKVK